MEQVRLHRYFRVERNTFLDEHFFSRENSIYLTETGVFEYSVNGKNYQAAELDCVIYKKGSFYDRRVLTPVVLHIFDFEGFTAETDEPISFSNSQRIRSNLALLNSVRDANKTNLPYVEHLLKDILYLYRQEQVQESPEKEDARISRAIELMRASFDQGLTIGEVAKAVHLSYPQFNRLFLKQQGISPMQYINRLRTDKAKSLLRTTDLPIKAIAAECGFRDIYYFSNFFKTVTGKAPTQYRTGKR